MRLWLQIARQNIANNEKFISGYRGIIKKRISDLSMSGTAVAVDGPRFMNNMRSDQLDEIKYLSTEELNRRRYWRTGEDRDVWDKVPLKKLSSISALLFVAKVNNV